MTPAKLFEALRLWLPAAASPLQKTQRAASDTLQPPLVRLQSLPGMDLAAGLASLQGNQPKYLALLRHFTLEHSQDMAQLTRLLQAQDQQAARRLVHTLRGVAGTLGLTTLADLALQLEHALARAPDTRGELMAQISSLLAQLTRQLGDVETEPAKAASPASHHQQQQWLRQMEGLLLQSDTAVIPLFEQHADSLLAGLGHWRLHLVVMASTFLLFPLLGLLLTPLVPHWLSPAIYLGFLYLCALPATVQSAIAFTSMAGGNVSAAVCSASASSILGIFLSPVLVGMMIQVQGEGVDTWHSIQAIMVQLMHT